MKTLFGLLIIVLLGVITYLLGEPKRKSAEEARALQEMKEMVLGFPKEVHLGEDSQMVRSLRDVRFSVVKSDAINAPVIGTITFFYDLLPGEEVAFSQVWHWRDGKWRYESLACLSAVNQRLFEANMQASPEMLCFVRYGKVLPEEVKKLIPPSKEEIAAAQAKREEEAARKAEDERAAAELARRRAVVEQAKADKAAAMAREKEEFLRRYSPK